jgi:hypothetical protein
LADLVFVLIVLGFFAAAAAFVRACERIVGPDELAGPDELTGPGDVVGQSPEGRAAA